MPTTTNPTPAETVTLKIASCFECPHKRIEPDPEDDWFCRDSVKAVCHQTGRTIERYIRPHQVERDLTTGGIPLWCPLR